MAFVRRESRAGSGKPIVEFDAMGKVFEVSAQPLEHWGRKGNVMLVLRDVTEREAAQKSLSDAGEALKLRLEENLRLQEQLEQQAYHDHLTGLFNRRHGSTVIPPLISEASDEAPVSLIILDLDYFKQVNDRYGHDVGDKVLSAFAKILADGLQGPEMAFRYGGGGISRRAALHRPRPGARAMRPLAQRACQPDHCRTEGRPPVLLGRHRACTACGDVACRVHQGR